jgi:hypothetical protein
MPLTAYAFSLSCEIRFYRDALKSRRLVAIKDSLPVMKHKKNPRISITFRHFFKMEA